MPQPTAFERFQTFLREMLQDDNNALHLDWSSNDEQGNTRTAPEDRCYLERMFALAGVA